MQRIVCCLKRFFRIFALLITIVFFLSGCELLHEAEPVEHDESGLTIYFIDVGQADSTLIVSDGYSMLIDGGNRGDSDLIHSFLKNHNISHLDYIVATHPDEDHIGGLSGALSYATASVALCPVTEHSSSVFGNFVGFLDRQGVQITVPNPGDMFNLGGSEVEVLGPVGQYNDTNNSSIVMKLTYGATSFLFTGDAERDAEQDILEAGYDISATVYHVGHHGSDTSTTYPFLREIMPQYAVISCGSGNSYGHPHDDTLSRLRDADVTVYRTDMQGTITCVSDGTTVSFSTERNTDAVTNPTQPSVSVDEEYYIGNVKSHKFHRPSCSGLPAEKNRVILETRETAINGGYDPCGTCKP